MAGGDRHCLLGLRGMAARAPRDDPGALLPAVHRAASLAER